VSAKRRRRRRSTGRTSADRSAAGEQTATAGDEASAEEGTASKAPAEEGKPTRRFLFGGGQPGPYPPLGVSLAVGLRVVGSSPAVLGSAFLTVLAVWGLFAALGFPVPPGPMSALLALPPLHVLFDAQLVQVVAEGRTAVLVGVALGVVVLRSITLGLLTLLVVDALEQGAPRFRGALRRLPGVAVRLIQVYLVELALVLAVPLILQSFLGAQAGNLGILLALIFGLHFLAMAPVVAATEEVRAQDAIRLSTRAARLPGLRHFALVFVYFFLVVFVLLQVSPPGLLAPATPTILVWGFVLAATVVHAGVLGAFAYRWLAVRDEPALRLEDARRMLRRGAEDGSKASRATRAGTSRGASRTGGKGGAKKPSGGKGSPRKPKTSR
jgi:hypothetical protein